MASINELLTKYQSFSEWDAEFLKTAYETMDFTVLCVCRCTLGISELTEKQQRVVDECDKRLAGKFTKKVLDLYADYFPNMDIHKWWGGKEQ